MEIYSGPMPVSSEVMDFRAGRFTESDVAIGLCVSTALDTLHKWLQIDHGSDQGFEPVTSGLLSFFGINPRYFIEYEQGEFRINANIDRKELRDFFLAGPRVVNINGIVDFTLRQSVRDAMSAINYSIYGGEDFQTMDSLEDEIYERLKSPIVDIEAVANLLTECINLASNSGTDQESLSYNLATFYTAGVAYNALLSEGQ